MRQTDYGTSSQDNQNMIHMLLKLERKFLTVQVLEEMIIEGKEKALLENIRYGNQLNEQKLLWFKTQSVLDTIHTH